MQSKSLAIVTAPARASAVLPRRLARAFDAVALTARQEDELNKTAAAVESAGAGPLTYPLDLREPRSVEILVEGTLDRSGRIDALLEIAGAVPQIDLFEMTDACRYRPLACRSAPMLLSRVSQTAVSPPFTGRSMPVM
jgi:3-oxoacyl-[acyl-carrier protein] reductase